MSSPPQSLIILLNTSMSTRWKCVKTDSPFKKNKNYTQTWNTTAYNPARWLHWKHSQPILHDWWKFYLSGTIDYKHFLSRVTLRVVFFMWKWGINTAPSPPKNGSLDLSGGHKRPSAFIEVPLQAWEAFRSASTHWQGWYEWGNRPRFILCRTTWKLGNL